MKIAMLGHKRIPSREGGIEIVVEEIATRLVKLGHQVDAYNRAGKHVSDRTIKQKTSNTYQGIRLIPVFTIDKKSLNAFLYSIFASLLVSVRKYDVIHYHAIGSCVMLWIPKLLRRRVVVTVHGLDWQRDKWGGFATKYLKLGERIAVKYADEIIVLSEDMKSYFKTTYGRTTTFVPNGVNLPEPKQARIITEKYGLKEEDYILFLSRLVPEKGLHYLLEAFRDLNTDKKLVIAGGASHSNDYVESIQKMAEKDPRVILTGFVQGQELEELFSNCFLYCLPSDVEGMPLSLLEAFSYGRRCLVSNIPENMQITKRFGIYFRKSNVEDLKLKLQEAFSTTRQNQQQIRQYVTQQFDWDKVVEQTLRIYREDRATTIALTKEVHNDQSVA